MITFLINVCRERGWAQAPATDLRLRHIHGLGSQLEEECVSFRWEGAELGAPSSVSSRGTGAQAAAEAETAALEFAEAAADQRRIALVKTHPHVNVTQGY